MTPSSPHREDYTAVAKGLHWIIAAGLVTAFALGWAMTDIPGITPTKLKYYNWHKWLGVSLLALSLLRIVWRAFHRPPALPNTLTRQQRWAATGMHLGLYLATLGVPVTGYLYTLAAGFPVVYLGLIKLPVLYDKAPEWIAPLKDLHTISAYSLASAVAAHAAAALWHHFVSGDPVLRRMLPKILNRKGT